MTPTFSWLFLVTLFRDGFLPVAYIAAANLVRLERLVCFQVSSSFQHLVRLLFLCWITGGHTVHQILKDFYLYCYQTHMVLPKSCLQSTWIAGASNQFHLISRKVEEIRKNLSPLSNSEFLHSLSCSDTFRYSNNKFKLAWNLTSQLCRVAFR